jgi:hypothetical protein
MQWVRSVAVRRSVGSGQPSAGIDERRLSGWLFVDLLQFDRTFASSLQDLTTPT